DVVEQDVEVEGEQPEPDDERIDRREGGGRRDADDQAHDRDLIRAEPRVQQHPAGDVHREPRHEEAHLHPRAEVLALRAPLHVFERQLHRRTPSGRLRSAAALATTASPVPFPFPLLLPLPFTLPWALPLPTAASDGRSGSGAGSSKWVIFST